MKVLFSIFTLVNLLTANLLFAANCPELREDLVAIEYKIQSSKLEPCKTITSQNCRPKDGSAPQMQKALLEVELEFNKAMGDLIVAESLATIGKTVEDSHNAVDRELKEKLISNANIEKAQKYLKTLDESLDKASILIDATEITTAEVGFWNNYQGKSPKELVDYINSKCSKEIDSVFNNLCLKLADQKKTNPIFVERVKTLHGFVMADSMNMQSRGGVTNRYENYRDNLSIKDGSGATITATDFQTKYFGPDGALTRVKALMKAYKENPTQNNATKLINLGNEIDPIEVNYQVDTFDEKMIANGETERVPTHIFQEIKKPLMDIQLSNILLTDASKENLISHKKVFDNEYKIKKMAFKVELKEVLNKRMEGNCNPGEEIFTCLRRLCDPSKLLNACKSPEANKINLTEQYKKLLSIEAAENVEINLERAVDCYMTEKSLKSKKKCLEKIAIEMPMLKATNISNLRKRVQKAEALIAKYKSGEPFISLGLTKGLALNALSASQCIDSDDEYKLTIKQSTCAINELDNYNYEAIKVAVDGIDVMIKVQEGLAKEIMGKHYKNKKLSDYRDDLAAACGANGKFTDIGLKLSYLCQYHSNDKKAIEDVKVAKKDFEKRVKIHGGAYNVIEQTEDYEEPNAYATFGKFFGGAVLQATPTFVNLYMGNQAAKDQRNYQLNQIDFWGKYNGRRSMNNPALLPYATNYGNSYYGNNFQDQMTFQSSRTKTVYSSGSPYKNSFTAAPPIIQDNNTTYQTNNDYSFSF